MRKRDELADPNSCLNKAGDDEWIFVLLGRDVAAPAAVVRWIQDRCAKGKNKPTDAQITEALEWVKAVETEQGLHPPQLLRLLAEAYDKLQIRFDLDDITDDEKYLLPQLKPFARPLG